MNDDERVVRTAWRALSGDDATIERVIAMHREPHRRYHTLTHVAWVVRVVEQLLAASPADETPPPGDRAPIRVAAIFHDAIYDPRSADNELRSAELAVDAVAALGWSAAESALVSRLILATAAHEPADRGEAVLLDADLSILGTDPATYDTYVEGVRAEYGHVDDDGWRAGRSLVLRRFLDRPHIYATTLMREQAELPARANLTAELAALAARGSR